MLVSGANEEDDHIGEFPSWSRAKRGISYCYTSLLVCSTYIPTILLRTDSSARFVWRKARGLLSMSEILQQWSAPSAALVASPPPQQEDWKLSVHRSPGFQAGKPCFATRNLLPWRQCNCTIAMLSVLFSAKLSNDDHHVSLPARPRLYIGT
jgi:hypothetical protein